MVVTTAACTASPGPSGEPSRAATSAHASSPRATGSLAIESLERALRTGDATAAADLAPPDDTAARTLLGAVARNAAALGIRPRLRLVEPVDPPAPGGDWTARVEVSWRFAADSGGGQGAVTLLVGLRSPESGAGATAITGWLAGSARVPVWLSGPVQVSSRPGVLVVVAGSGPETRSQARRYGALAVTAGRVVHRVLPGLPRRLVVEVPHSAAALDRALGAAPGANAGIAAVTASVDGSATTGSPVHVFVNPDVFEGLRPLGARVVLSHEMVHVATRAAHSDLAPWLLEGFADYVALRDVRLPVTRIAEHAIEVVRRDGVPAELPGVDEFAADAAELEAAYEEAWLACALVAEVAGEQALVGMYDDVDGGESLEVALHRWTGLSLDDLRHRWQARLRMLAAPEAGQPRQ